MDLRARFTFFFSTVFLVFLSLFSIVVYSQVKTKLLSSVEETVRNHLQHEFTHLESPHIELHSDHGAKEEIKQRIWRDDKIVDDSLPGANAKPKESLVVTQEKDFEGHHYRGVAYYDLQPTLKYLNALKVVLLLGVLLSLVIIIPLSFVSTRFLLKPFNELAQTTRKMTAQTLSRRLTEPKHHDDEYGILVSSFNGLLTRLQRSFDQTSRFATNASHELRTPIAVIIGQAERALRKSLGDDDYRVAITKILSQATTLKNITQRLLSLSDLERADNATISRVPVKATLDEIVNSLHYSRETHRQIDITTHDEVYYRGNREILLSIANNLVENSLKFSRERVEIRFSKVDGVLRLEVSDDGPGIPHESREKVFEPFVKSPSKGGHGLGLAIVKACVESCKGAIRLGTSGWGGLSVVVELPEPA